MNRFCFKGSLGHRFGRPALIVVWALLSCFSLAAVAQSTTSPVNANAAFSVRATHLLGFENAESNRNGTLSIQDNALQFQQRGKSSAKIGIASVRDVSLSGESRQVGGVPMTLGKAAAPYGGGRVVSLFAHKKYDTLSVEYEDGDGGIHGAIFQLNKGKGELVRNELVARGVSTTSFEDQPTKATVEVAHEKK